MMNARFCARTREVSCWLLIGILFCPPFCSANSQSASISSPPASPTDVRTAAEFSRRFQKRLIETKDLGALVDEFFTANPNRFFPNHFDEFVKGAALRKQIKIADWDNHILPFMSFCYLFLISTIAKNEGMKGDISNLEEIFPTPILEKVKKDPHLAHILTDGFEPTIKSAVQMRAMTQSLKVVLPEYSAYLNNHLAEWRPIYDQAVEEMERSRRVESSVVSVKCHDKDCYGKPEGTQLLRVLSIPFNLTLVNEQGQWKVLKIEIIDI